jgi:hypothetical protein
MDISSIYVSFVKHMSRVCIGGVYLCIIAVAASA